jgi:hypothetical protein
VRWLVVMTYLNGGMVLICFGQLAHVNQCRPHLEKTFFVGGGVGVAVAALIAFASAFMAMVELVHKRQKARRAYAKASRH